MSSCVQKERNASAKAALSAQLQRVEQALSKETQRRTRQEVETKFKVGCCMGVLQCHDLHFIMSHARGVTHTLQSAQLERADMFTSYATHEHMYSPLCVCVLRH